MGAGQCETGRPESEERRKLLKSIAFLLLKPEILLSLENARLENGLSEKWNRAVQKLIKDVRANYSIKKDIHPFRLLEILKAIQEFDINKYVSRLSEISGIPPHKIQGYIKSIELVDIPPDENGTITTGRFDYGVIQINTRPYKNNTVLDKRQIQSTVCHEVNHSLTIHKDKGSWYKQIWDHPIPTCVYEGATEVVVLLASENNGPYPYMVDEYSHGSVMSAWIISQLVGESDFVNAYLTQGKDPKNLLNLLEYKVKTGAGKCIFDPIHPNFKSQLSVLYNLFKYQDVLGYSGTMDRILKKAWERRISQYPYYFDTGDISGIIHFYAGYNPMSSKQNGWKFKCNILAQTKNNNLFETRRNRKLVVEFLYVSEEKARQNKLKPDINENILIIPIDDKIREKLKIMESIEIGSLYFISVCDEIRDLMIEKINTYLN